MEFADGEVDFEDFEDFDDDDCGLGGGVEGMEDEIDVPGHEEWEEDDPINYSPVEQCGAEEEVNAFNTAPDTVTVSSSIGPGGYGSSYSESSSIASHSRETSFLAPKSKLSLRQQKSSKTRVCELDRVFGEGRGKERAKNPPVASVKPIQQRLPHSEEKQPSSSLLTESELFEEPVVVRSVFEVENNSWKLHPFLKIKVYTSL